MTLRLATFNLKDFFLPRNEQERPVAEAKIANIAASLRRANADVVAMQEVGSTELLDRLVTKEVKELGYGAPLIGTEDKRGIRNVLLSRLPVQWSQVHTSKSLPFPRFVEGDPDPFPNRIPLRRGVVHARVDVGGAIGELDVMTAHFKSNLPAALKTASGEEIEDKNMYELGQSAMRSLVQRAAEALYVRSLVDGIFATSPDHSVCVMGDLNDTIESLPLKLLRGIDTTSKHWLRACADMVDEDRRYSCYHGGGPSLIDHILVSEPLHRAVLAVEIHNEKLRYHGPHVDNTPMTDDSDHALCVAILEP